MKRHSFDPLSFVFGVIFILIAASAAWNPSYDWDVAAWVIPAGVLVLGIGLLASTLRSSDAHPEVAGADPESDD
ncbi:MAG: hypothetical protein M3132_03490 [Actinomycetia bacterium]|nr:hypothetical protein [Actinomycetes bacterium]